MYTQIMKDNENSNNNKNNNNNNNDRISNIGITTPPFINNKSELWLSDDLKHILKLENNSFIGNNFQENELIELKNIYLEGLGLLEIFETELVHPDWKFISKEESDISVWSKPFNNPYYENSNVIGSSLLSKNQILDVEPEVPTLFVSDWLCRFSWDRYLDRFEIVYYFTTNDRQKAQKLNIPYSKYDILLLHMYTNMSLFVKSRDCVILQISGPHPTRKGSFFTVSRDYNEFIGCPKSKEYIRGGLPIFGYIFEPMVTYDCNGIKSNGCFSTHICSFDFGNEGKTLSDYLLVPIVPKISLMNLVYKIKFIRNKTQHQKTIKNYMKLNYYCNDDDDTDIDGVRKYLPNFSNFEPEKSILFQQKSRDEWINFFKDLDEKSQWNSLPSKLNNICVFYDRHSTNGPLLIKTKYQVSFNPNSLGSFMFEEDFQWDPFIYHMILEDTITTLKGGGPVISSKFKYNIPFFNIKSELKNGSNTQGYFLLEQRENGDIFMFSFDNLKFKSDECSFTTYFLINPDNWRDKLNPSELSKLNNNHNNNNNNNNNNTTIPGSERSLDILMLIKSSFSSHSNKEPNKFDDPLLIKVIYLFSDIIDYIHSKVSKESQVLDSIKLLSVSDTIHHEFLPSITNNKSALQDQILDSKLSKKTLRSDTLNNIPSSSIPTSSISLSSSTTPTITSSSTTTTSSITPSDSFLQDNRDAKNTIKITTEINNNIDDIEIDNHHIKSKKKKNSFSEVDININQTDNNNNTELIKSIISDEEIKTIEAKQQQQQQQPIIKSITNISNNNLLKNSILLPPFIPSINNETSKFFSKNYKKQTEGDGMEFTNLFYLPHEIIVTVLSYLDHRALCKVSRTCKYMKQMSELDVLWYRLYVNIFGDSNFTNNNSSGKPKTSRKGRSHNNNNSSSNQQLRNLWDSYVKTQFQLFSPNDINFDNPSLTFFLSKETNYETIDQQWKKNFFLKIRMEVLWQISKIYGQPKNTGPSINGLPNSGCNRKGDVSRISLMSIASYRISPSQFAMIPNEGEGSITSIFLDGEKSYSGYSTGETYMIDFNNIKECKPIKLNYTPQEPSSSIHLWTQGDSLVYSGLSNRKLIQYHPNNIQSTKEIAILNSKIPNRWSACGISSNSIGNRLVVHYNSNEEESEFEDFDTVLDVFDADTGKLQISIPQDDLITAVHTHTNRVAVGGSRGPINLWDLNTGKKVITFLGHTDEIYSCKVLSKEDIVVASSKDGTVRFFDERTGPFYIKRIVDDIHVKSFDVEPKKILCGGGSRISYWDPRNLTQSIGELYGRPGSEITKVQLSQFNVAALFQHGSSNLWKFNV